MLSEKSCCSTVNGGAPVLLGNETQLTYSGQCGTRHVRGNNNIIIILSFDIAPFPYKHAQRRITFIVRG